ncbi:hypothetical protein SAMN04488524_2542 [Pedobacter africanus]|uniref:Chaperone of endosialidase n=1 Tax=Pedobacter africanus TaxID=151894 RepID=A0A1W2BPU7_9SPHI|nr:hypothetical protein SAMN04488524_2542 [Pedobacter africanus]
MIYSTYASAQQTNVFPNDGNVGIGFTNPSAKFTVIGGGLATSNAGLSISSYLNYGRLTSGTVNSIHNFLDQESLELSSGSSQKTGIAIEGLTSSFGSAIRMFTGNYERFRINSNGDVGVGTSTLDNSQGWNRVFQVNGPNNAKLLVTESTGVKIGIYSHSGYNGKIGTESNHNLTFTAGYWNDVMTLTTAGNVGIGTTSPDSKLAVNGNIRAREIKVENSNWPDYVFAKDYELPALQETEKHIKDKGHLPGIPSAAEVKANGIDLGEMNAKLLQKIEELTLHLIEMKKDSNDEREKNKAQQKEIEYLKSKLK